MEHPSTNASGASLAHVLIQHSQDDVLTALQLYYSARPEVRDPALNILDEKPLARYTGEIISFNADKNYGFIRSQEATSEFDKDVYCAGSEIGDFRVGEVVTFTIVLSTKQQPQARLLQEAERGSSQSEDEPPATRYIGEIISFNEGKNFGFIRSSEASTEYDKDVYCSGNEIGDFRVGDTVSFTIVLNNKSQPQARCLQEAPTSSRYMGEILSFSEEKGFGFIGCPEVAKEFGKDCYLSRNEMGDF